jgi:hypothetical protein
MTVDSSRVELLIPNDDRLIAGIEPVIDHAAERAGLSSQERQDLTRDAAVACGEAFSRAAKNGSANPLLHVLVNDFPNRVEIAIEQYAGSAVAGTRQAIPRVTIVKEHSPSAHSKR